MTRSGVVTGVQTCALPIYPPLKMDIRILAQELREGLMDIMPEKSPLQSKPVKAPPLFASPNHFEALSKICNSEEKSPNTEISEYVPTTVSVPVPVTTSVTPRIRKSKWEKALPDDTIQQV